MPFGFGGNYIAIEMCYVDHKYSFRFCTKIFRGSEISALCLITCKVKVKVKVK
jgi:hypothetical protein